MAQLATQQFLEVDEVRDGIIILKTGSIRGVLMVSSQNFALKSDEEQDATIFQYQAFLNSLDFSLQIVVQSRKLNLTGYLDELKQLETNQKSDLMRRLTKEYRAFVEQLIAGSSIMAKNFFVVVPFSSTEISLSSKGKKVGKLSDEQFQRMKSQLWQRMEFVALGLRRAGSKVIPLNSEEVIELLWSWHHPKEAEVGYYPEIPSEVIK